MRIGVFPVYMSVNDVCVVPEKARRKDCNPFNQESTRMGGDLRSVGKW